PKAGRHVVRAPADTDMGMPDDRGNRVFDPFITTKGAVDTGPGLSASYSIIQRHSGEMRVESEPGRGTVFTIVLPVGTPEVDQPRMLIETEGRLRGRILLVDNELPVMHILGEMLNE